MSAKTDRDEIQRLEAELARVRAALTAMLDCISTDPMMDGSERNPAINDRRCMLVAIRQARAVLAEPAAVDGANGRPSAAARRCSTCGATKPYDDFTNVVGPCPVCPREPAQKREPRCRGTGWVHSSTLGMTAILGNVVCPGCPDCTGGAP